MITENKIINDMKRLLLFLLALGIITQVGFAQEKEESITRHPAANAIYLELGGNSFVYSFNYDRIVPLSQRTKIALGAGLEAVSSISINGVNYDASLCLTPAVNFLFGKKSSHFETGLALFVPFSTNMAFPSIRIGYRYQPWEKGFLFRIGFTPLLISSILVPWGGISLGYAF